MVRIPYIKIPSVRVGSIDPTSNIGTGGATPAPPTPITYLTQWKIVGNSEVHGVGNLTSWKVSGNSVVDNNTILSCGDYSDVDGKYHVKISNGVTIYDIPLTEPLRKVNDVADTIEFPSSTEGKALITRRIASSNLGTLNFIRNNTSVADTYRFSTSALKNVIAKVSNSAYRGNIICAIYDTVTANDTWGAKKVGIAINNTGTLTIYDDNYNQSTDTDAFLEHINGVELIYELATPITEFIDVSPFPVSPTDTYTSANVVPYSAFEHTENKEIWSCGEYNPTDSKYHILVQPQGGSIADIALTEPLRKVNDVADTIEFPTGTEGKALVTRPLASVDLGDCDWLTTGAGSTGYNMMFTRSLTNCKKAIDNNTPANILCGKYTTMTLTSGINKGIDSIAVNNQSSTAAVYVAIYDANYNTAESLNAFAEYIRGTEVIYELATPTTELVDVPQIQEADSYSMVISQGGKAVEWSSFETNSE